MSRSKSDQNLGKGNGGIIIHWDGMVRPCSKFNGGLEFIKSNSFMLMQLYSYIWIAIVVDFHDIIWTHRRTRINMFTYAIYIVMIWMSPLKELRRKKPFQSDER